jgi:ribosomal protein S6
MTNEEKDKKEYELALILRTEDNLAPVLTLVGQHNGEGVSEPRAKRLMLAYEIKKQTEAVFAYFTFKAFGDDIKNLETDLNSQGDVLRFMVIASPAPAEHVSTLSSSASAGPSERRARPSYSAPSESKPAPSRPLSNEALEKKIEEILQ